MANHLGNVLQVVSDRKLVVSDGVGGVDLTDNEVKVIPDKHIPKSDLESSEVKGIGLRNQIYIAKSAEDDEEAIAHEFGHNLGLLHTFGGLMNSVLNSSKRVSKSNILDIIGRGGIGKN